MSRRSAPTVSVIVVAYNEQQHIGRLLESLREQQPSPLEILVADDGSRDRTAQIAEASGAQVLRLAHRGPARAKNAGARRARGEVLVFLDADMEAGPGFLERLVEPIAQGRAKGTFTRDMYLGNSGSRWARAYAAIRWSPPDRFLPVDFPDRWGNFRAIRRDAFLSAGGFDDVGYGEDLTLATKLGEEALAAPGALLYHHEPSSIGEIIENGRWIGRGAAIRSLPLARRLWHHSPPRVLALGVRQVAQGRTPWVLPARGVYHAAVLLGQLESRLAPQRHWK